MMTRVESVSRCSSCAGPLSGRQRRFCCRVCKNADTNYRHQSYASQQARGLKRKLGLIAEFGASCARCGYDRNSAALAWHHVDPRNKSFSLDLRSLSNRSEEEVRREARKCILVCANCHAEIHWPLFDKVASSTGMDPERIGRAVLTPRARFEIA